MGSESFYGNELLKKFSHIKFLIVINTEDFLVGDGNCLRILIPTERTLTIEKMANGSLALVCDKGFIWDAFIQEEKIKDFYGNEKVEKIGSGDAFVTKDSYVNYKGKFLLKHLIGEKTIATT